MSKEKKADWSDYLIAILLLCVIAIGTSVYIAYENSKYPAVEELEKRVECYESAEMYSAWVNGTPSPC